MVIVVLIVLVNVLAWSPTAWHWWNRRRAERTGRVTTARVIDVTGTHETINYQPVMKITLDVAGSGAATMRTTIPPGSAIEPGDRITVVQDPSHPDRAYLPDRAALSRARAWEGPAQVGQMPAPAEDGAVQSGEVLASEAEREATQAVLKQAFEDQRLTQDEFESRVGRAVAARTRGELAELTHDLPAAPAPPARRGRRRWPLAAGITAAAVTAASVGVLVSVLSSAGSGPARSSRAAAPAPNPGPGGPGRCPVGTSATALSIANDLAGDPVYVEPGSGLLTTAQAGRLQAEISQVHPGRIRIAAVTPATVRQGGGERALANAIASCQADTAGTTIVTTTDTTYVVTSYPDDTAASQAVGAALNTHASMAPGLMDAVRRLATVDNGG